MPMVMRMSPMLKPAKSGKSVPMASSCLS
ncbi:hypothetical protein Goshw_009410 [Gossypium schwendimanii]|uniref:Uncharacterized protein n=3 Tax=Gossypium TaxID=3633 RepID=A0A7J9BL73_GOSGO|nr:hypothetical protein [Gossypium lobatum]MBA0736883.1 hypothetical protein [Gossypium gossypioides]MBA0852756.1 hypothetical protein [Gossypium schwendimanii]